MIKTIEKIAGVTLLGISALSAQTNVVHDPDSKICYEGTADRWNDDNMGNITLDTEFVQFDPMNPDAPDSFSGSFDLSYTGEAPIQQVSAAFLSFTFDPAVTTVSLPGINVPDSIMVGDEEWDLCHVCYDFSVDFTTADGTLGQGGLDFMVFDEEGREIVAVEGVYSAEGPISFGFPDGSGSDTGAPAEGSLFTVTIDNVEVCYCVPEPSTASLGLLALGALVTRRKR